MPSQFRTNHHVAEILQQATFVFLFLAIFLPQMHDPDYIPGDELPEEIEQFIAMLLYSSTVLLGTCVHLLDPSRGPYNQFAKPEQFFDIALCFPDRWFRHLFR